MMCGSMDITLESLEWIGVKECTATTRRKQSLNRTYAERRNIGMDRTRMQALLNSQALISRTLLEQRRDLLMHEEVCGLNLHGGFCYTHLGSNQLTHVASTHR